MQGRARQLLAVGIFSVAVVLATTASGANVCEAPVKAKRTSRTWFDTVCDASCGALSGKGLAASVPSGTGIPGSGSLQFVDMWHAQCVIRGGPLDNQCKSNTVCPPGFAKQQDGGVWKCSQSTERWVITGEAAVCRARAGGGGQLCGGNVDTIGRKIADAALTGKTGEVLDAWKNFAVANKTQPWFIPLPFVPPNTAAAPNPATPESYETGYAYCVVAALKSGFQQIAADRAPSLEEQKKLKKEIAKREAERAVLLKDAGDAGVSRERLHQIQKIDTDITELRGKLTELERTDQLRATALTADPTNITYAKFFIDTGDNLTH